MQVRRRADVQFNNEKQNWQQYLRHDPIGSPWSEHARERLQARVKLFGRFDGSPATK